jgi:GNAT superfamily N-acetyltransferase
MSATNSLLSEITASQLPLYKAFFISGLVNDEENFRISPQDEQDASFPTKDLSDSFTLGAYVNNYLAGVVSFERDGSTREKLRHKGTLFRMYVAKEFRAQGVGKKLMEEVLLRVKRDTDIEQINLTVVARNHTAKQLYEKFGFRVFSVEEHAIKWKGKYFTEEQLVLNLR